MAGVKGKSGRKPKPTALHVVDGTKSAAGGLATRDRIDPVDSTVDIAPVVPCPDWLPDDARDIWKMLAPEMESLQLLTLLDTPAFVALCVTYSELRWTLRQKQRFVKSKTTGVIKLHPVNGYRLQVIEKIRSLTSEFGITPAGRARVEAILLGGNRASPTEPEGSNGKKENASDAVTDRFGNAI